MEFGRDFFLAYTQNFITYAHISIYNILSRRSEYFSSTRRENSANKFIVHGIYYY